MIPKIFHQVWINDRSPELPDRFKMYRDSWLRFHPEWSYRLWNLETLDFVPESHKLLGECRHPAQMADLLRIEILYRFGGVYIDTDFECLRPIDDILDGAQFFSCSEDGKSISTGIIGSIPQSRLLKLIIDNFPSKINVRPANLETGPGLFTSVVLTHGFSNDVTIFPTKYFYPFNCHNKDQSCADMSMSYAVHHYEGSWQSELPFSGKLIKKLSKLKKRYLDR